VSKTRAVGLVVVIAIESCRCLQGHSREVSRLRLRRRSSTIYPELVFRRDVAVAPDGVAIASLENGLEDGLDEGKDADHGDDWALGKELESSSSSRKER